MAPPLYFLPKLTLGQLVQADRFCRAIVDSRGLGPAVSDVRSVDRDTSCFELTAAGPGGSSGVLLCVLPVNQETPKRLQYAPQFQTWHQAGEGLWIGVDNEHPPAPEDLARREQFNGYRLELHGATWQVPIVRDYRGHTQLPRDWIAEADGSIGVEISDAYRKLWEGFASVVDVYFDPDRRLAGAIVIDPAEGMRRCIEVLGLNYRFGSAEQNHLRFAGRRLIGSDTWSNILAAAIDLHTYWDVFDEINSQKKTEVTADPAGPPGSPPTSPGSTATDPATDPAAPS